MFNVYLNLEVSESSQSGSADGAFDIKRLRAQLDAIDPAATQIAVIGSSDSDVDSRMQTLYEMIDSVQGCPQPKASDTFFSGKSGERKPTKVFLLSFSTRADRDTALHALRNAYFRDSQGSPLVCRPALSFSSRERNKAISRASRLLEAELAKSDSTLKPEIDWKNRKILLSGVTVFAQDKDALGGTFTAPYAHLRLR